MDTLWTTSCKFKISIQVYKKKLDTPLFFLETKEGKWFMHSAWDSLRPTPGERKSKQREKTGGKKAD